MKGLLKQSFSKFMKESAYRAEMTLYFNFAINVIYAVFKTVCGFVYHSVWMGTLAFYYILLSFMRLLLVKGTKHVDTHKRWKKYCQCGWLLLLFTIALVGMSILIRKGEGSIHYPGYLIYGVATYTFYSMVIAIRNVHKSLLGDGRQLVRVEMHLGGFPVVDEHRLAAALPGITDEIAPDTAVELPAHLPKTAG